eukprot:scaffold1941_cov72-Skeletonema_dohrnii-CCMP3373.AAC.1
MGHLGGEVFGHIDESFGGVAEAMADYYGGGLEGGVAGGDVLWSLASRRLGCVRNLGSFFGQKNDGYCIKPNLLNLEDVAGFNLDSDFDFNAFYHQRCDTFSSNRCLWHYNHHWLALHNSSVHEPGEGLLSSILLQSSTMTNDQEDPRRLTVVLNDPNTEWKDIRSALRARTRGGLGCSTNLAMINASCTGGGGGGGPDGKHNNNPMLAAAELIKLQVEADEGNRRASVESWNSNRRPSRRTSCRASTASRRRSSLRWSGRSSVNSLQSSFNFNDSVTSKGSVNMMDFGDSVNIMDFGVSQRLAVLDESRRELLLDESRRSRSCASLDGLDELKEEM